MSRKKLLLIVLLLIWFLSFFISVKLGVMFGVLGACIFSFLMVFLFLNKKIKKTNWWRNQYMATEQFVSNSGYRDNIIRNYEIVNLGSNPARFAFFYEKVKGQSWATGSQGQDMDFEILKYYHSYLKEGATVLIPVMPFTAISPYLKERPDYWGVSYYSRFAKILDGSQVASFPVRDSVYRYSRFPLLYNWKAVAYILRDEPLDVRYQASEQPMMEMELEQDAIIWINNWLKEFNLRELKDVLDIRWMKYYEESINVNKQMVDYCLLRGLKPVFICIPMTKHLSSLFPDVFYKFMISDFIRQSNEHNIPFLDYTHDERFQKDEFFFNSYFMNMKGRKFFTAQVIKDLSLN